uniref:Uncharacterized protein n=2 Tax=Fervidobacterium pennivorans TaxID=93466 RepID=A0A7V4KDJ1_FERPE
MERFNILLELVGFTAFFAGLILNIIVSNALLSKVILLLALLGVGAFIRNPYLVVLMTIVLIPSRYFYTPVGKDVIHDLKKYLFNRTMLRSKTYLMLALTGSIFLGFALPSVKNYPVTISIITLVTVLLLWVVDISNMKSFEEKIKRATEKGGDPIEALKYAYKLMNPFTNVEVDEIIKNRIELFKNIQERKTTKE